MSGNTKIGRVTRDSNSSDKREVDSTLIFLPVSIIALFEGYLKLVKAAQKGEKSKQGCDDSGPCTPKTAHWPSLSSFLPLKTLAVN